MTLGESQPCLGLQFFYLYNGANDLSLLPKDCLEVGLGSKQKRFSYFQSNRDEVPAPLAWPWGMGTGDPAQLRRD